MFADRIRGRRLVVWSDNKGAENSTRKGSSKQFDHTCMVHAMWLKAVRLRVDIQVERVPTKDNISDSPSREDYRSVCIVLDISAGHSSDTVGC